MNEIGKVSIKLIADTNSFFRDIKKAVSQVEATKLKLSITADTSQLQASISKSLHDISALKSTSIGISADDSKLNSSISNSLKQISSLKSTNIAIGADSSKLTAEVVKSSNEIKGIKGNVSLNIDDIQALNKVDQVKSKLDILQLKANDLAINPKVDDTKLASLQLQIASTKERLNTLDPSFLNKAFSGFTSLASSGLETLKTGLLDITNTVRNFTLGGVAGIGVGLGAGIFSAVTASSELSANLGQLKAQLQLTDDDMSRLQKASIDLGNDIHLPGISAKDATTAFSELAKNGLSVNDVLASGKSVLELAKVANIDFAESARIVATQLNVFGIAGDQASNVSNRLTKAAGASGSTIEEFAGAANQAGLVAKNAGLDFNQFTDVLGVLSLNGLRGSDAGTSLKTAILKLSAPTKQASDELNSLGIKIRDASGQMLPFDKIAQNFNISLGKVDDVTRDTALSTIFGTDAIRVGAIITEKGSSAFDKYAERLKKTGDATQQLAGQTSGLKGVQEAIGSFLDTANLQVGIKLEPIFTKIANNISNALGKVDVDKIGDQLGRLIESIGLDKIDFTAILGNVNGFIDAIVISVQLFIDTLKNIGKFVVDSVGGFDNLVKILEITAITIGTLTVAMTTFAVASSPITLTILAIEGAIIGLASILGDGDIGKGLDEILSGFKNTFGFIKNELSGSETFITPFTNNIDSTSKNIQGFFDNIDKAVGGLSNLEAILGIVTAAIITIGVSMNALAITTAIVGAAFDIYTLAITIATGVTTAFGVITAVALSPITLIVGGIALAFLGLAAILGGGDIKKGIGVMGDAVKVTFGKIGEIINGAIKLFNSLPIIIAKFTLDSLIFIGNFVTGVNKFFADLPINILLALANISISILNFAGEIGKDFNIGLDNIIKGIVDFGKRMGDNLNKITDIFVKNVANFIKPFVLFVKDTIQKFTDFWNSLQGSIPSKLGQVLGYFLTWEINVYKSIGKWILDTIGSIFKFGEDFIKTITQAFSQLPSIIGKFFSDGYKVISDYVVSFITKSAELGLGILSSIIGFISQLPSNITSFFDTAYTTLAGYVISFSNSAYQLGSGIVANIVNFLTNLPSQVGSFISSTYDTLVGFIGTFATGASNIGQSILNGIIQFISDIPKNLASGFQTGLDTLADFGTKFYNKAIDIGKSIIDGIVNGIKQVGNNVGSAVGGFTGGVGGVFNNAAGAVNDFAGGVLKGFHFSEGGIVPQYFATGGGVKGTDTIPAFLTPGEHVINKDSSSRFAGILETINNSPDRFGQYIRDIGRLGNNTNISNESKVNNINVNIAKVEGTTSQIQKTIGNIGYSLQSELLNRGIL